MNILVIGKTGQLATALGVAFQSTKLQSASHGASKTDMEAEANGAASEMHHLGRPELDLENLEAIEDAIIAARPDIVINAAAYTGVDLAESERERALLINALAAEKIAAASARIAVPIIHISTDYVFDGARTTPYLETDTPSPLGVYGQTKLQGEHLVAAANARHCIVRTSWVYSPWGNNFVKTMLRLGAQRETLSVVDDQFGNPTSALDLARALLAMAKHLVAKDLSPSVWGIYHATGLGETTWFGFAKEIFAIAQSQGLVVPQLLPIPTSAYPTPAKRPKHSNLNCQRIKASMNIELPVWPDGLKEMMETDPHGRQKEAR